MAGNEEGLRRGKPSLQDSFFCSLSCLQTRGDEGLGHRKRALQWSGVEWIGVQWSGEGIRTRRHFRSSSGGWLAVTLTAVVGEGQQLQGEAVRSFARLVSKPLHCSGGQGQHGKPEAHVVET